MIGFTTGRCRHTNLRKEEDDACQAVGSFVAVASHLTAATITTPVDRPSTWTPKKSGTGNKKQSPGLWTAITRRRLWATSFQSIAMGQRASVNAGNCSRESDTTLSGRNSLLKQGAKIHCREITGQESNDHGNEQARATNAPRAMPGMRRTIPRPKATGRNSEVPFVWRSTGKYRAR